MNKKNVFICVIEDDSFQRALLVDFLKKKDYEVWDVEKGEDFFKLLPGKVPDVVLLDWRLPGMQGNEVLKRVKKEYPYIEVIVITAFGSIEQAVEAMKEGAFYYVTKPVDLNELDMLIEKALEHQNLRKENEILREVIKERLPETPVVFESSAMKNVISIAKRVASTDATILITGESGTGKELIAEVIHSLSPRAGKPLVKVNIAAIPETLIESELFGHEKGAFTGADKRRIGKFESADKGTLFLDEIGELPISTQVKLLRFLQERTIERLGSNMPITLDVRIIAATNRNLETLVKEGKFREDLFYRLNVINLHIPPLRERREDIFPLAKHFLKHFSRKHGKNIKDFTKEAWDFLLSYDFPGNVRELQNLIERACVLANTEFITLKDLTLSPFSEEKTDSYLDEKLKNFEKQLILDALEKAGWVQKKAAEMLGLSERALRYRMEKVGIKKKKSCNLKL